MRPRRSLFGPVLLIALGIVLLAENLDPRFALLRLFATYWPWILIFWGGFRVIEFAAARLLERRAPEPLGGGAVILAIFLCLAGSLAHGLATSPLDWQDWLDGRGGWFSLDYEFPVQQEQSLIAGQGVLIRNLEGRVRISPGEEARLSITGQKRVRAFNQREADKFHDESPLEVSPQDGLLVVQPKPLPSRESSRIAYDVEIEIAPATALIVEGARGYLDVQGLAGPVRLDGSASMEISELSGAVTIQARRVHHISARRLASTLQIDGDARRVDAEELAGKLTIEGNLIERVRLAKIDQPAQIRFQNTSLELQKLTGELEITPGSIEIQQASGPLVLRSDSSQRRRIRVENVNGTLTVEGKRGNFTWVAGDQPPAAVEVKLEQGDIAVVLPSEAAFAIEAATADGKVSHEFGDVLKVETKDGSETLRGGKAGGPVLKLQTGRGDIRLEKTAGSGGHAVEI